jgi:hypothetical protein
VAERLDIFGHEVSACPVKLYKSASRTSGVALHGATGQCRFDTLAPGVTLNRHHTSDRILDAHPSVTAIVRVARDRTLRQADGPALTHASWMPQWIKNG